jgi:hypothetical protein
VSASNPCGNRHSRANTSRNNRQVASQMPAGRARCARSSISSATDRRKKTARLTHWRFFHIAGCLHRCAFDWISRLHRQLKTTALVGLEDLDAHLLAFFQIIGHGVDTLVGDLGDVQQAILAWHDLDDRAEVEQFQEA